MVLLHAYVYNNHLMPIPIKCTQISYKFMRIYWQEMAPRRIFQMLVNLARDFFEMTNYIIACIASNPLMKQPTLIPRKCLHQFINTLIICATSLCTDSQSVLNLQLSLLLQKCLGRILRHKPCQTSSVMMLFVPYAHVT